MNVVPPKFIVFGAIVFVSIILLFNFASTDPSTPRASIRRWRHKSNTAGVYGDILNSTLGFEKILVLNMPERSDKRDAMTLAASLTGFNVDYVDGIRGDTIPNKSLPIGQEDRKMTNQRLGSWRAHMNTIRTIIEKGYSSALILEDDADWDIRIKSQLTDFARGSRFILGNGLETSYHSPYGEGWDILWVGLCHDSRRDDDDRIFVISNDFTAPAVEKLYINNPEMLRVFPNHSRIVHKANAPICTYAYALTYAGAQKILYSLSVKELRGIFDNALAWWCQKNDQNGKCVSVSPTYFQSHQFAGGQGKSSDINPENSPFTKAQTYNIRWSTRLNVEKLLRRETDFNDSYPD